MYSRKLAHERASFLSIRSRRMIKAAPIAAAIINPKSSFIPKLTDADKLTTAHKTGITSKGQESFSVHINKPKVKMTVGQGTPKLGDAGNVCPNAELNNG